jgi:DNA-binding response OmpR family regulator
MHELFFSAPVVQSMGILWYNIIDKLFQKTNMPGKKILIAEDEKTISRALVLKLHKAGFTAKPVYNGFEALQAMDQETYDLVLLDLIMPKIDGFGVLEELKKRGDTTAVIVSSNLGQETDVAKAKALGATDYFIKSNTQIEDVIKRINAILN